MAKVGVRHVGRVDRTHDFFASKWRVGTLEMAENPVFSSLGCGGCGVNPAVTTSATRAVSAVRKIEPTLYAERTLSSIRWMGNGRSSRDSRSSALGSRTGSTFRYQSAAASTVASRNRCAMWCAVRRADACRAPHCGSDSSPPPPRSSSEGGALDSAPPLPWASGFARKDT